MALLLLALGFALAVGPADRPVAGPSGLVGPPGRHLEGGSPPRPLPCAVVTGRPAAKPAPSRSERAVAAARLAINAPAGPREADGGGGPKPPSSPAAPARQERGPPLSPRS